jgi:hypothetical protein
MCELEEVNAVRGDMKMAEGLAGDPAPVYHYPPHSFLTICASPKLVWEYFTTFIVTENSFKFAA